jgi:hypothetical protein
MNPSTILLGVKMLTNIMHKHQKKTILPTFSNFLVVKQIMLDMLYKKITCIGESEQYRQS